MLPGSVNLGREAVKNFVAVAAFLSGGKKDRRYGIKRLLDPAGKGYSMRDEKDYYPGGKRLHNLFAEG